MNKTKSTCSAAAGSQPNIRPALLNDREAAIYLGMSTSYLRKARRFGQGPTFVRIGMRAIRYRVSDLHEFVESGAVRQPSHG